MSKEHQIFFESFDQTWNIGIIAMSLIALTISLLTGPRTPVDAAWFALVLCAAPIVAKIVAGVSDHHFDSYNVFALAATIFALFTGNVFGAAAIAFLACFISTVKSIEAYRFA